MSLLFLAVWLQLNSPHFELYTDAGEKTGRDALRRLELIREVFARDTPLPVRVVVFGSGRDWRDFRPNATTLGFYQSAPEYDWIAMVGGDEAYRAVFHEYVHLVLNHASGPLPRWLEEGTAEYYSTLRMGDGRVLLGAAIPGHVQALARVEWLDARALQAARTGHGGAETGLFYAQSWALVHMLNSAPGYRTRMPRFAELLDRSVPPPLAFEQAFGKPISGALADLRVYLKNGRFAVADVLARNPDFEVTVKPAAESAPVVLTELLLQLGKADEAERRIGTLPESARAHTARGLLALARRQGDVAAAEFRKAGDLHATDALPYFEYALLVRERGGPAEEVNRYLTEAVGRNPKLAEAQFLLGLAAQRDGKHKEAVERLEQATAILPRQSYFWHALAISYHELKDNGRARRAALRAVDSAGSQHELEMAQAALRLTVDPVMQGRAAEAASGPRKDVVIPPSWQAPKGESQAEGILEHIDCLGVNARFHIRVEGKPMRFYVEKPGEILLNTMSAITFEFACGPQRARRVRVQYNTYPNHDGRIMAIDFLNGR